MAAPHRRKGSAEGGIVQAVIGGLYDHLSTHQRQADLRAFLDVHGCGDVPGEEDAETPTDALDLPPYGHASSITCV